MPVNDDELEALRKVAAAAEYLLDEYLLDHTAVMPVGSAQLNGALIAWHQLSTKTHAASADVPAGHVPEEAFLTTERWLHDAEGERDRLHKWFHHLVDFVRRDQCTPNAADPEPCLCCPDYLQVAEHAAKQAGLFDRDVKTPGNPPAERPGPGRSSSVQQPGVSPDGRSPSCETDPGHVPLPVWAGMPDAVYTPTRASLSALLAGVRRETVKACATFLKTRAAKLAPPRSPSRNDRAFRRAGAGGDISQPGAPIELTSLRRGRATVQHAEVDTHDEDPPVLMTDKAFEAMNEVARAEQHVRGSRRRRLPRAGRTRPAPP